MKFVDLCETQKNKYVKSKNLFSFQIKKSFVIGKGL